MPLFTPFLRLSVGFLPPNLAKGALEKQVRSPNFLTAKSIERLNILLKISFLIQFLK
jgi:hypothetical protein